MTVELRRMEATDISLGMRFKEQAGWNQTAADWQRFLDLEPDGCFVAVSEGRVVGTTTTCVFGSIAWIAMVLVDKSSRHRGIGTRLVQHALHHLDDRAVPTVRLDATPLGQPVYERMGFVAEHGLVRLEGIAPGDTPETTVVSVRAEHRDSLIELDVRATGTDRKRLIERLVEEQPRGVRLAVCGEMVLGYVMLRPGSHATQIGPAVAVDEQAGRALCDWALRECAGQPVFIDVPRDNRCAVDWASARGLVQKRPFTRMFRGRPVAEQPTLLWASSGPEKG